MGQSIMKTNTQTLHFPIHSSTYPLHQSQDKQHRWPCVNGWGGGAPGISYPPSRLYQVSIKSHIGYVVTQGRNTMWLNSATNMVALVCEIDLTMDVLLENGTRCCGHSNILYKETFLCASLYMLIMRVKHQSHKFVLHKFISRHILQYMNL